MAQTLGLEPRSYFRSGWLTANCLTIRLCLNVSDELLQRYGCAPTLYCLSTPLVLRVVPSQPNYKWLPARWDLIPTSSERFVM